MAPPVAPSQSDTGPEVRHLSHSLALLHNIQHLLKPTWSSTTTRAVSATGYITQHGSPVHFYRRLTVGILLSHVIRQPCNTATFISLYAFSWH